MVRAINLFLQIFFCLSLFPLPLMQKKKQKTKHTHKKKQQKNKTKQNPEKLHLPSIT